MAIAIGHIEALFRYPVKSMQGVALDAATMGWHGLEGDRRFAVRRLDAQGPMPWLTASRLPELIGYAPVGWETVSGAPRPTHVRTPDGDEFPLDSELLAAELGRRHGAPVELMHLGHGIFDETSISVITTDTSSELCRLAGATDDVRRFRANIVVRSHRATVFEEDDWVGGVLAFGADPDAPAVAVTMRDLRCVMVNLDPAGGPPTPAMMKTVARIHDSTAGVYATVVRTGQLAVGQPVVLHGRDAGGRVQPVLYDGADR